MEQATCVQSLLEEINKTTKVLRDTGGLKEKPAQANAEHRNGKAMFLKLWCTGESPGGLAAGSHPSRFLTNISGVGPAPAFFKAPQGDLK